jgi:hypothetical protein
MLKEWYAKNPSSALNGKRWNYRDNLDKLNNLQNMHHEGKINLYETLEAYTEVWKHIARKIDGLFISAHPIPGTRKRNDLPPVYIQWKDDIRRRLDGNT